MNYFGVIAGFSLWVDILDMAHRFILKPNNFFKNKELNTGTRIEIIQPEKENKQINNKHNFKEITMKKSTLLIVLVALSVVAFQAAFSQTTANQTATITVGAVQKLAVTGTPSLTIGNTEATAGTDLLASVTSPEACTYSYTHNAAAAVKITASIPTALAKGKLEVKFGAGSYVDISNATTAVDIQTGIAKGAGSAAITYQLSGIKASDGVINDSKVVTYTITN